MLSPSAGNERQIKYCLLFLSSGSVGESPFKSIPKRFEKEFPCSELQDWLESENKRIETPVRLFTEQKETKTFFSFS